MYLASSLVRCLQGNTSLDVHGLEQVTCPLLSCRNEPEKCDKGQNKLCAKPVRVGYEYEGHHRLVILIFHYQLNGSGREGFIRKEDAALKILLKRGIINSENLDTPDDQRQ